MSVCRLDSVSLDVASPNAIDLAVAADVERCECPQGYTGTSCEVLLASAGLLLSLVSGGEMCAEVDVMNVCMLTLENSHVAETLLNHRPSGIVLF